jgi:protein phosphatase 2C family protein 2/3
VRGVVALEISYGFCSAMEDRTACLGFTKDEVAFTKDVAESYAVFCVFDGHGGVAACERAREMLPGAILASERWKQGDTQGALRDGFAQTEAMMLGSGTGHECGSTASVAVIRGHTLHVANVGDTMAVLSRDGKPLMLTTMHTPLNDKEHVRVENEGGRVVQSRVCHPVWNGSMVNLGVTRALGSAYFKLAQYTDNRPSGITAEPDLLSVVLRGWDEFLLIGSDGFWETVAPPLAVDFVRKMLCNGSGVDLACREVVELALARGASDNVTVLLVVFHTFGKSKDELKEEEEEERKRRRLDTNAKENN